MTVNCKIWKMQHYFLQNSDVLLKGKLFITFMNNKAFFSSE